MTAFDGWKPSQRAAEQADAARRADRRMLTLLSVALAILWLYARS